MGNCRWLGVCRKGAVLLVAGGLSWNCGGVEPASEAGVFMAPLALEDQLVFVDRASSHAYLLDVAASDLEPTARRIPVRKNPVVLERRRGDTDELLIVSAGDPDPDHGPAVPAALTVLGPSGVDRVYELGTSFDAISQSDDGRYVVAFFDPSPGASRTESLLVNPLEIAVLDLGEPPSDENPVHKTLTSFGEAPRSVVFSPELDLAGSPRRVAVVLFQSQVSLFDLGRLDLPEFEIELSPGGNKAINLSQVTFDVEETKLYLRGNSSSDVYVVQLSESEQAVNDFAPSLNQLTASTQPADMALYGSGAARRLLVAASAEALVIEADSNRVTAVPLEASAKNILLFEGRSPTDSAVRTRALLYGTGESRVSILDLEDVEERRSRNVETVGLSQAISRIVPFGTNQVLAIHQSTGLSLIDLEDRTVAPIGAAGNLQNAVLDPSGDRLWVAPPAQSRLGFLELENFHPSDVRLDADIQAIFPFTTTDLQRVVVTHPSAIGHVTVLDAEDPRDLTRAVSLKGFLVSGRLDEGQ